MSQQPNSPRSPRGTGETESKLTASQGKKAIKGKWRLHNDPEKPFDLPLFDRRFTWLDVETTVSSVTKTIVDAVEGVRVEIKKVGTVADLLLLVDVL